MNRYKLSKAGVDVNQGLKRLDQDKEFYERLLKEFCADPHYQQLKQALEQGEVQQAFQYGHALKGAAGNLSFVRLYDTLVPLVDEVRNGNLERGRALFSSVSEAYEVLISALREL